MPKISLLAAGLLLALPVLAAQAQTQESAARSAGALNDDAFVNTGLLDRVNNDLDHAIEHPQQMDPEEAAAEDYADNPLIMRVDSTKAKTDGNTQTAYTQPATPESAKPAQPAKPADTGPRVKVYGNKTPTFVGTREEAAQYKEQLRQDGAYDYDVNYNNGISTDPYYNYNYPYGSDGYYPGTTSSPGTPVFYYQSPQGPVPVYRIYRRDPLTGALRPYLVFANGQDASHVLPPPEYSPMPDPGFTHPADRPYYPPINGVRPDPVDPGFNHPGTYPNRPHRPHRPHPGVRPDPVDPGFNHPGTYPNRPHRPHGPHHQRPYDGPNDAYHRYGRVPY